MFPAAPQVVHLPFLSRTTSHPFPQHLAIPRSDAPSFLFIRVPFSLFLLVFVPIFCPCPADSFGRRALKTTLLNPLELHWSFPLSPSFLTLRFSLSLSLSRYLATVFSFFLFLSFFLSFFSEHFPFPPRSSASVPTFPRSPRSKQSSNSWLMLRNYRYVGGESLSGQSALVQPRRSKSPSRDFFLTNDGGGDGRWGSRGRRGSVRRVVYARRNTGCWLSVKISRGRFTTGRQFVWLGLLIVERSTSPGERIYPSLVYWYQPPRFMTGANRWDASSSTSQRLIRALSDSRYKAPRRRAVFISGCPLLDSVR